MTVTYRCIGKGTTNSAGVAHMTHSTSDNGSTWTDISSNPGYTGTGKGLVQLCASTDDPSDISSGSIQSETYEVRDCVFKDLGVSPHPSWSNENSVSVSAGATETTVTTSSSNGSMRIDGFDGDYGIEFDFSTSNDMYIQFRQDTTVQGRTYWSSYFDGQYHHAKITTNGLNVSIVVDGNVLTSQTLSGTWNRVYMQITSNATVKYKNFAVYSV